jgi:hypothetical protein
MLFIIKDFSKIMSSCRILFTVLWFEISPKASLFKGLIASWWHYWEGVEPLRDKTWPVAVAHTCNPSYSGGRDQPARANSS